MIQWMLCLLGLLNNLLLAGAGAVAVAGAGATGTHNGSHHIVARDIEHPV